MDREQIQKEVDSIPFWFHSIDLGGGIVTPGVQGNCPEGTQITIERLGLPSDLSGIAVLDIGCWDGAVSFECERRGASVVLGVDRYGFPLRDSLVTSSAGFWLVHNVLGSKVMLHQTDFLDLNLSGWDVSWELVIFAGVLYHLEDPMRGLRKLYDLASVSAVIETHIDEDGSRIPSMRFWPGSGLNNDPTNWWSPNIVCLQEMVKSVGFKISDLDVFGDRAVVWVQK